MHRCLEAEAWQVIVVVVVVAIVVVVVVVVVVVAILVGVVIVALLCCIIMFMCMYVCNPNKPRSATCLGHFQELPISATFVPRQLFGRIGPSEQSGNLLDSNMVLGVIASCPCNTTTMPLTDWRKDAAL